MENIFFEGQVIWAQIDANRHMRHSAYADYGAQARSNMLKKTGLSLDMFAAAKIGPILFREELIYLREVKLDDFIKVTVEMTRYNWENSRFSFKHEIFRKDGTLCAVVNADGAWLNLETRKLTALPPEWDKFINQIPQAKDIEIVGQRSADKA